MGGIKTYRGIHTLQQAEKCCQQCYTYQGNQTYRGHPNIQQGIQIYGGIQTYGWCPNMGGIQTYRGCPNMGASKHTGCIHTLGHSNVCGHIDSPLVWHSMLSMCCVCTGDIQTTPKHTVGCSNIWWHPNIWVMSKHMGVSTHIGGIQTYGRIQTYRVASKCMGTYGHSLSVTKHAFFVLCMYGGIQTYRGCPNIWGHPNIQGVSKHTGNIQT